MTPAHTPHDAPRTPPVAHPREGGNAAADAGAFLLDLLADRDAAERLRGLGLLSAGLVHDLANVCSVIVAQVGQLRHDPTDAVALQGAEEAAARVHAMLRDTRGFLRGAEVAHVPTDLGPLVRAVLPWLHRVVGDRCRLALSVPTAPVRVRVAPLQFERMLVNLVRNAADAQPDGGAARISVGVAVYGGPYTHRAGVVPVGTWGVVRVEDDGPGIPAHVARRVFEPLRTTKAGERGTGLGLPTAALVMREHDGYVAVEDADSGGAAISLHFPLLVDG